MPNLDLPILIVDDARFSSAVIHRTLKNAGYRNIRSASSAPVALALMEKAPASVMIADWLMPGMDGLELTDRVRQMDEQCDRYTYILLLTARDGTEALIEAFDRGVDDFVHKADMNQQLLSRIHAAVRLAERHNQLLEANRLLRQSNQQLGEQELINGDSGLPNQRYALRRLHQALSTTAARGGATGYVLLAIRHWQSLCERYPARAMQELAQGIGRRLSGLIRPMDALCRTGEDQFSLVAWFQDPHQCTTGTFRRLQEGINHKAFRTSAGFISVESALALCVVESQDVEAGVEGVTEAAEEALRHARDTHTLTRTRPSPPPPEQASGSA
ncbi:MAG: response regulator [Oleiphilaceae bacterium]|nr:response regulator [Oleiphilaceae bacterium]